MLNRKVLSGLALVGVVALLAIPGKGLCPGEWCGSASAAMAQDPPSPPSMSEAMGHVRAAEWDKAIEAFKQIVEHEPENGQAWFYLAYSTHLKGDIDAALKLHKKAAEFDQFRATAMYNVGCVHALKGEKDKAFEALREAVDEGFTLFDHAREDADLESLRSDPRFAELFGGEGASDPAAESAETKIDLAALPAEKHFDFLVGSWTITTEEGPTGREEVKRILDGAVLEQQGTFDFGETGPAMAYKGLISYDAQENVWRQTWVSNTGQHDQLTGSLEDGKLIMRQEKIAGMPDATGRLIFYGITTHSFNMNWEISSDDGATWATQFTAHYRRDGEAVR